MLTLSTPDQTIELGEALGGLLTAGDLVILDGPVGAGKTTLTRGIGAGLGVRGPVTSPTFVIARVHPSQVGGPPLVHVDAYRLDSVADIDALDLDSSIAESVTIVEWGAGRAEQLAGSHLVLELDRPAGTAEPSDPDRRSIRWRAHGGDWDSRRPRLGDLLGEEQN